MTLSIIIRDFRSGDDARVAEVIRDSFNTLRKSRGGHHPDEDIDLWQLKSDRELVRYISRDAKIMLAQVEETGEVVGTSAYTARWMDFLVKSAYIKGFFVKEKFQRGRQGANIGTMLHNESITRLKKLGLRKCYGFSLPESYSYYKMAGAVFFPEHDITYMDGRVPVHYFEFEISKSPLNRLRLEPYLHKTWVRLYRIFDFFSGKLGFTKPEF